MSESEFYTPTDIDALRMENELLAFEVRFLRARLRGGQAMRNSSVPSSPNRLAHLEGAEQDLVLLLRRMGSSPLGPLFRRRKSFRSLEERYLHSPMVQGSESPAQRLTHLEGAEQDLVLLLRRMGSSPLGPLFRRRKNFRSLEERYL